jgi:hypothetical protein
MKKFYSGIVAIFIFAGCGNNFAMLKKDNYYENALYNSNQAAIIESFEAKAYMSATYLNKIDSSYNDGEYLFFGLFITDDFDDKNMTGLENKNYSLKLNGKEFISKTQISRDSNLSKNLPFVNNWSKYYILKFPKDDNKTLTLTLSDGKRSSDMVFVK